MNAARFSSIVVDFGPVHVRRVHTRCTRRRRVSTRAHTPRTRRRFGVRAQSSILRDVSRLLLRTLSLSLFMYVHMFLSFSPDFQDLVPLSPVCTKSGMPSRKGASREVCASTAAPNSQRTPRQRKYREIKAQPLNISTAPVASSKFVRGRCRKLKLLPSCNK